MLRGQVVGVVAAFDKMLHDLIRIGMCKIYGGFRPPTPKYLNESISFQLHNDLIVATLPPREHIFERAIVAKLSHLSFQHPDKISDGLAFIWNEKGKWDKIGAAFGTSGSFASTKMKLISSRRNAIVHESDMDPITNLKTPITRVEVDDISDFVTNCGNAVVGLVL